MKLVIFFCLFLLRALVEARYNIEDEWKHFKIKYGKSYTSTESELQHYRVFQRNLVQFYEHNERYRRGETTFMKGINQFADLELETNDLTTRKRPDLNKKPTKKIFKHFETDVPESIDWREKGAVGEVRDATDCTSGTWAYAAVGAVESHIYILNGSSVTLSPQSLIDCDSYDGGCQFGTYDTAFEYIRHGGISLEEEYLSQSGKCSENVTYIKAVAEQFGDDEEVLWGLVGRFGPVAVELDGFCLFNYASGILSEDCGCTDTIRYDFFALVVGYGSENGVDYWLLKNSWGKEWGENGYFRFARNGTNTCGIVSMPYYLVVTV